MGRIGGLGFDTTSARERSGDTLAVPATFSRGEKRKAGESHVLFSSARSLKLESSRRGGLLSPPCGTATLSGGAGKQEAD